MEAPLPAKQLIIHTPYPVSEERTCLTLDLTLRKVEVHEKSSGKYFLHGTGAYYGNQEAMLIYDLICQGQHHPPYTEGISYSGFELMGSNLCMGPNRLQFEPGYSAKSSCLHDRLCSLNIMLVRKPT